MCAGETSHGARPPHDPPHVPRPKAELPDSDAIATLRTLRRIAADLRRSIDTHFEELGKR